MRTEIQMPEQATAWGLALLRIVLGWTAITHGWVKLTENGIGATGDFFGSLGVPLPQAAAVLVIAVELIGGAALVLGIATRISGLLLATVMAVALATVHAQQGFFAAQGGYEFVLVLTVGYLAVSLAGPGAMAVTTLLARTVRGGRATQGRQAVSSAAGA